MLYDELHRKFGNHIAKRVQLELSGEEFKNITLNDLIHFLEVRAEEAHKQYRANLDNPFLHEELMDKPDNYMDRLYRRWCSAEDLAYLLTVADDVSMNVKMAS